MRVHIKLTNSKHSHPLVIKIPDCKDLFRGHRTARGVYRMLCEKQHRTSFLLVAPSIFCHPYTGQVLHSLSGLWLHLCCHFCEYPAILVSKHVRNQYRLRWLKNMLLQNTSVMRSICSIILNILLSNNAETSVFHILGPKINQCCYNVVMLDFHAILSIMSHLAFLINFMSQYS